MVVGGLQPKSYFMVQAFHHHPPRQGEAKLIHIASGAKRAGAMFADLIKMC